MAEFKCVACHFHWKGESGMYAHCPKCENLYIIWIDYEKIAKEYRINNPDSKAFGG